MSKKIGLSKNLPKSDVRPLGTPRPKESKKSKKPAAEVTEPRSATQQPVEAAGEKNPSDAKKVLDNSHESVVSLSAGEATPDAPITAPESESATGRRKMTLTFKGLSKNGKQAFYTGAKTVQRFLVASFVDGKAPTSFEVDDVFDGPRQPKAKMTAEERKAANAAKPKPTLAEQIAKREASLAKLRQKAEAPVQASL